MAGITPKERVKMTIAHTEPDRPPIQAYFTPEILAALNDYFKDRTVEEAFELDFRGVGALGLGGMRPGSGASPTAYTEKSTGKGHGGAEYYDMWGVGYTRVRNNAGGEYLEATDLTLARLATMDDVQAHPWPDPDDFDYSVIPSQIEKNIDKMASSILVEIQKKQIMLEYQKNPDIRCSTYPG